MFSCILNNIWESKKSPEERTFTNSTLRLPPTGFYCFHAAFFIKASNYPTCLLWELGFKSLGTRFARGLAVVQLPPNQGFAELTHSSEWISKSSYSSSDMCAAEPHVHLPTAERLPRSPAVPNQDAADHLQICQNAKMLAFWMRLPDFFCIKKNIRLFYYTLKNSEGKQKSKKLVFSEHCYPKNLSRSWSFSHFCEYHVCHKPSSGMSA